MERMNIAVGTIPQARLVVEVVEAYAALPSCPVAPDQMLHPTLHKGRADRDAGIAGGAVGRDRLLARRETVAAIGIVWIERLLRRELRLGKAAVVGVVLPAPLGRPADQRNGQQCICAGGAVPLHKLIRR